MNLGVDFSQASTLRGLIWLITAAVGAVMAYHGQDVSQLLLLAGAVAGGLGVTLKDPLTQEKTP